MPENSELDIQAAHKHFSADCFNECWVLIDKKKRNANDDEQMILLALSSLWHWTKHPNCTPMNLSIGYWQVSRAYALIGEADNSLKYALRCLEITPSDSPFGIGYAYEALARAEKLAKNHQKSKEYVEQGLKFAAAVTEHEDQQLLKNDLKSLV